VKLQTFPVPSQRLVEFPAVVIVDADIGNGARMIGIALYGFEVIFQCQVRPALAAVGQGEGEVTVGQVGLLPDHFLA
jgi:hypothetical protein